MMSTQAFNALLKTLEEPPSYVVFILATTEYNKLPTTIVSRCQRFDFRRMTSDVIVNRLAKISEAEGIELSEDGARLIARASRGGMRDAVSLLELCAGSRERIDAKLVSETIGTGDRDIVYTLVDAIGKSDFSTVYKTVESVVSGSADISVFWQEIIDAYRDIMVVKNSDTAKAYLDLTESEFEALSAISKNFTMAKLSYHTTVLEAALADMQRSQNSKRSVAEIALTKMCDPRLIASPEALALRIEELEKQISKIKLGVVDIKPQGSVEVKNAEPEYLPTEKKHEASVPSNEVFSDNSQPEVKQYSSWMDVVERISEVKPQLASGLRKAEVSVKGKFSYIIRIDSFYAERLAKSAQDMTLLYGAIAEKEGTMPDKINVKILSVSPQGVRSASDEIENALKF